MSVSLTTMVRMAVGLCGCHLVFVCVRVHVCVSAHACACVQALPWLKTALCNRIPPDGWLNG